MIGGSAIKKFERLGLAKLQDDDHAEKSENKIKCIGQLHEDHCD